MFEVEKNYGQVRRDSVAAQNVEDVALLENYASSFSKAYELIDNDIDEMKDAIDEYKRHVDDAISTEEEAYNKKIKEEAIKRKITENTGKIATAGGKTVTFEPDLEDIERMEELIKKEGRKVLDFSDSK
jgi:phage shock protein A